MAGGSGQQGDELTARARISARQPSDGLVEGHSTGADEGPQLLAAQNAAIELTFGASLDWQEVLGGQTRQQPETAKGTTFISLEDETGDVQSIVHRAIWERQRQVMLNARLLGVKGVWQRDGEVMNLIAGFLVDLTPMLGRLRTASRDFR